MYWDLIKISLGIIFLLCCLSLPFLLFFLGLSKKKLGMYIQQIKKSGKITKNLDGIGAAFDMLLITHIFDSFPSKEKHPEYYRSNKTNDLINQITILTKVVKPLAITTILVTISLITLLNIYES